MIVGISACLTGQTVRYDGRHKYSRLCMQELSQFFDFRAFCPEVAVGMGTPRAPIHLVGDMLNVRALGVDDSSFDVSDKLQEYARSLSKEVAVISGYIFTERSPSCGLYSTKVLSLQGDFVGARAGIFAAELKKMFPLLPMEEAGRLEQSDLRRDFINNVHRYHRDHA